MEIKAKHVFALMAAAVFISLFAAPDEKALVPSYPTLFSFILLGSYSLWAMWEIFKSRGSGCLSTLGRDLGGHSTIHPDDIRLAKSPDNISPSFVVLATGGFVYGGFEMQGSQNFIVTLPEYVEKVTNSGHVVRAKLQNVTFEQMPGYVQQELLQLKHFDPRKLPMKNNLWFGMTAEKYETNTVENRKIEEKLLEQSEMISYLKEKIKDLLTQKKQRNLLWKGYYEGGEDDNSL